MERKLVYFSHCAYKDRAHAKGSYSPKCVFLWREFTGQMNQGQQDREPLRGKSVSERVSEREGVQRFSEVVRDFLEVFRGPLRDLLRG